MRAEFINAIAGLAQRAAEPKKVETGDRTRVVYLGPDGKTVEFAAEHPPRSHKVGTLTDLIRLGARFSPGPPADDADELTPPPAEGGTPVCWYNEERVVLVLDDSDHRRSTATLALQKSDHLLAIERLVSGPWLGQKDFVRLLQVQLAGTLDPAILLEKVRQVKFENGSVVTGTVKRDQESIGRTVNSLITTEKGQLPEEVTLALAAFKTPDLQDFKVSVRCFVEMEPLNGAFKLTPFPDAVGNAIDLAVAMVGARLGRGLPESVPAYRGEP